ncbi:hypothetical protein GGF48_004265, partial [Coemansia sp. RSA 921]
RALTCQFATFAPVWALALSTRCAARCRRSLGCRPAPASTTLTLMPKPATFWDYS